MKRSAFAIVLVAAAVGCAKQEPAKAPPGDKPVIGGGGGAPMTWEGGDWFPVGEETVYTYQTLDVLSGEKGVLMLKVRRTGADRGEIVAPKRTTKLVYSDLGVLRESEGTYMLRTPVKEGTSWPAGPNASMSIARVGFSVETPAGSFSPCAEVVERRAGAVTGTLSQVYCKGVGLVTIEAKTSTEPPEHMKVTLTKVERSVHVGPDGLTKVPVTPK